MTNMTRPKRTTNSCPRRRTHNARIPAWAGRKIRNQPVDTGKQEETNLDIGLILMPLLQAAEGGKNIGDEGLRFIAAGIAIGLGGLGPAIAIGMLTGKAMEALGRNPEAQPVIQTNMILGIAFAEAVAIYALVVAVMIGFVF
jgi:F-type H+-transporting ATPase subunit c